jgi:hypothetical protein
MNSLTISVSVAELTSKLISNRNKHAEEVKEAIKGHQVEARDLLEKALDNLSNTPGKALNVHLVAVEDHTKEYDQVIEMLKMHKEPKIDMESFDFDRYVLDNWEWKKSWEASNSKYIGTSVA